MSECISSGIPVTACTACILGFFYVIQTACIIVVRLGTQKIYAGQPGQQDQDDIIAQCKAYGWRLRWFTWAVMPFFKRQFGHPSKRDPEADGDLLLRFQTGHKNASEYVPICLLLLLCAELQGANRKCLIWRSVLLGAARVVIYQGHGETNTASLGRLLGICLTLIYIIVTAYLLIPSP